VPRAKKARRFIKKKLMSNRPNKKLHYESHVVSIGNVQLPAYGQANPDGTPGPISSSIGLGFGMQSVLAALHTVMTTSHQEVKVKGMVCTWKLKGARGNEWTTESNNSVSYKTSFGDLIGGTSSDPNATLVEKAIGFPGARLHSMFGGKRFFYCTAETRRSVASNLQGTSFNNVLSKSNEWYKLSDFTQNPAPLEDIWFDVGQLVLEGCNLMGKLPTAAEFAAGWGVPHWEIERRIYLSFRNRINVPGAGLRAKVTVPPVVQTTFNAFKKSIIDGAASVGAQAASVVGAAIVQKAKKRLIDEI